MTHEPKGYGRSPFPTAMERRWPTVAIVGAILVLVVALLIGPELLIGLTGQSSVAGDEATVTVHEAGSGDVLGEVGVDLAETSTERYAGLSNVDELPPDRGMLFVFDEEAERTFVMREMSFGLDIVFIDGEGTITAIHEAPAPGPGEDGEDRRYTGTADRVLEVNRGWTAARGVSVGDRIAVEYHD